MFRLYHAVVSHEDLAQAYGRCWARPSYNSVDAPGPVSLHSRCYGQSYGRGTEDLSRTLFCYSLTLSLTPVVSRCMFI